jgi:general secretion pathway protein D
LEVKILELDISDEHRRGIDWLFSQTNSDGATYGGGFANGIPNVDGSGGGQEILPANSELVPQGTGIDQQAAIFSYVSNHVRARVQLMELEGKARSLATPTLLVTDSEASRIFVGSESTILTRVDVTSNTTSGDNPVTIRSYDPTTERRNIGTSLLITPRIHADRTVTIRVMQENSQAGDTKKIVYGIDDDGNQLYFDTTDIDQRTITTTVIAKNTETIAIGGLITEEDEDSTEGLPWVDDIPILGKAFERIARVKNRSELIILIRPYVLLAPGEGESISMEFLERMSEHPSAKKDLPELGIGRSKPFKVSPDDPWYRKLYGKLKIWDTMIDWGGKYDENEAVQYEK